MDSNSVMQEFVKRGLATDKTFKIDDDNRKDITFLINYFFGFMQEEQMTKGIALLGNVGSGKTISLRIIQQMLDEKVRFTMVRAGDIANDISIHGESTLSRFKNIERLMIDDIGEEEDKKNFGNKINAIAELLTIRYDVFVSRGFVTHISTNLSSDMLIQRYGERVGSRMTEMFQFIEFMGPDRRHTAIKQPVKKPSDVFKSSASEIEKERIADSFLNEIWRMPLQKFIISGDSREFQDFSMYEVFRALWKKGEIKLSKEEILKYNQLGFEAHEGRGAIQCPWQLRKAKGAHTAYQSVGARGNTQDHSIKFNAALIFMWDYANQIRNEKNTLDRTPAEAAS